MLESSIAYVEERPVASTATALPRNSERNRPSRPVAGRSLGASVTAIEPPVRSAVAAIVAAINVSANAEDALLGSARYTPGARLESPDVRVAWAVVSIALIHAHSLSTEHTSSFAEALLWFSRDRRFVRTILDCASPEAWQTAEAELAALTVNHELWDLLPYVLEPHGHVTRTRLESCDLSRATRDAKKSSGVFYTPSDVAEFLVRSAAASKGVKGTWFDPACGTGVFLRSVLTCARSDATSGSFDSFDFIRESLFGVDLSALSTDLTCLVLLAECTFRAESSTAPIDAWRTVRSNVVCGDSLRIVPLNGGHQLQIADQDQVRIETLFGEVAQHGFDHVIMNPPYAAVPFEADSASSWASFLVKAASGIADAQTAFTEMLWKFTHAGGSGAAVLPLSIGTNTSTAYCVLREELSKIPAVTDFLFFDREPQALFGEDIKTRNLILIVHRAPTGGHFARTSRMLKWTAKQRPSIFTMDRLVPLDGLPVKTFVPKLGCLVERDVYRHLSSLTSTRTMPPSAVAFARATMAELLEAPTDKSRYDVLVSATAYNFLNVFIASGLPEKTDYPFSSSPLNKISFAEVEIAQAAIAILSSRLSFWLWHVEGDGFHVTSDFLRRLPLWVALRSKPTCARLAEFGSVYWAAAKTHRVESINGGKQTSSFHTGYGYPLFAEVDELLLGVLGSPIKSSNFLDSFIKATVSVDGTQRDRGLL